MMDTPVLPPQSEVPSGDYLTLADYAERAYLDYAISVVKGRALPDVRDGQKPVQRRILFEMSQMGLGFSGASGPKARKSAAVVGNVLGRLHPHGDTSVYDALVRMAQDFSLRYPLIDGQGNFGSRDGDGAAAMRYTEARLTPIAQLLLDEIDEGTVDFQPNYDGTSEEPLTLPARLPMVLLNGASGIAVGLATEIPPHNLREVARAAIAFIQNRQIDLDGLRQHLPAPDFPGGGQIISADEEIRDIYANGRGSLKMRARWQIEELARGQWQMVVTELPHGVSAQKVLEEIEELTNPKIKLGKKSLSADQLLLKQTMLGLIDTVRDESGKDAPVRLVLAPKTRNLSQSEFITGLLAHTSLESSVPVNLVMIGLDGRPRQKVLRDIISEWVDFRFQVVTRRTQFRLNKVDERIHILEGRLTAFIHIEQVIRIIREADEPKAALMQAFPLSDRQAEDILEIRLRQLARLEGIRIEQELEAKRIDKRALEELLANPNAMKKQVIKEVEADAKQFGDDRRTLIQADKRAVAEVKTIDEPVTVVVSSKGWLRARQAHGHDAGQFQFKAGDTLYAAYECRTIDTLLAFGDNGRVYSIAVAALPGARGDGQPITSFIDLEPGSRIVHFHAGAADDRLLIATTASTGFIAKASEMASRQKGGKSFITLDEGAELLPPIVVPEKAGAIATLSQQGRLLVFGIDEVKHQAGGGRGVNLQELDNGETLLAARPIDQRGVVVSGLLGGKERRVVLAGKELAAHFGKRARKGKSIEARLKPLTLLPVEAAR